MVVDDDDHVVAGQLARLHLLGEEAGPSNEGDGVRHWRAETAEDLGSIAGTVPVDILRATRAAVDGAAREPTGEVRRQWDRPTELSGPDARAVERAARPG